MRVLSSLKGHISHNFPSSFKFSPPPRNALTLGLPAGRGAQVRALHTQRHRDHRRGAERHAAAAARAARERASAQPPLAHPARGRRPARSDQEVVGRAHHRGPECAAQLHAHENGGKCGVGNSEFRFVTSLSYYFMVGLFVQVL